MIMDIVEKYLSEAKKYKYFNWKLFYKLAKSNNPNDIEEFQSSEDFMDMFSDTHIQKALSFSSSFTQFMKYKSKKGMNDD